MIENKHTHAGYLYIPGDNWAVCQRCGFDTRSSKIKKEWTGLFVCSSCFEPRHEQELLRVRTDKIVANIITGGYIYNTNPSETSAIAGVAIAGVTIVGEILDPIPSGSFNSNVL